MNLLLVESLAQIRKTSYSESRTSSARRKIRFMSGLGYGVDVKRNSSSCRTRYTLRLKSQCRSGPGEFVRRGSFSRSKLRFRLISYSGARTPKHVLYVL